MVAVGSNRNKPNSVSSFSGGRSEGETPVPIPNTEVKPISADGTWGATPWESRTLPTFKRKPREIGVFSIFNTTFIRFGQLSDEIVLII